MDQGFEPEQGLSRAKSGESITYGRHDGGLAARQDDKGGTDNSTVSNTFNKKCNLS